MDHHSEVPVETREITPDKIDTPNPTSDQVQVIVAVGLECIPTEYEIPSTSTTDSDVQISSEALTENQDTDLQLHDSSTKSKRKSYDSEYKLYVAELAEKFSNRSVARVFNIDDKRVREWRKQKDKLAKVVQSETASQLSADASKKKRSYNAEFKLQAVEIAEKSSNRSAARAVNVHEKRIREWRKQKELLQQASTSRKRLGGGGRKPLYAAFEDKLFEWLMAIKDEGVTRMMIQKKALELSCETLSAFPKFSASRGWLDNFLRRKGLIVAGKNQTIQLFESKFSTETAGRGIDVDKEREMIGNEENLNDLAMDVGQSMQDHGSVEDDKKQLSYAEPLPSMAISSHLVSVAMDEIATSISSPVTEAMSIPSILTKTVPTETVSKETVPSDTMPSETTSAETTSAETTSAEPTSAEPTSAETTSAATTSAETTSAATTSAETTSAATTSAETTSAETKSAEATSAEDISMKTVKTETVKTKIVQLPESMPTHILSVETMSTKDVPSVFTIVPLETMTTEAMEIKST